MLIDPKIYAALDLGTYNCRLSIARIDEVTGTRKIISQFSRHVLLGQDLAATGCLSEQAMDRAIVALKLCKAKLAQYNIYKKRYVATQACRLATNSQLFIDRVYDETGLTLEIIDNQSEANLAAFACLDLIKKTPCSAIVFDIGGGSSQISLVGSPLNINEPVRASISLPLGVVTLAEKFRAKGIKESFTLMKAEVKQCLESLLRNHALANIKGEYYLLGMSGTATTLATKYLGLKKYDRRAVEGLWLKQERIERVINEIVTQYGTEQSFYLYSVRQRAELLIVGCAILACFTEFWPAEAILVTDCGIRDGILAQLSNGRHA